jgi:ion channel-forming bestrophin family protein
MAIKGPVRYSTDNWIECLTTWPTSRITQRIKGSLSFVTIWTILLTGLYKQLSIKWIFPAAIHSIVGSTLSLLLVFRTNSAYDRFWEGRKCWTAIVVAARDIARLASLHISELSVQRRIARLLITFAIAVKQHLQGEKLNHEFRCFLDSEEEISALQQWKNRPSQILKMLSTTIHHSLNNHPPTHSDSDNTPLTASVPAASVSTSTSHHSDAIVSTLHNHLFEENFHILSSQLAACERIVKQPVPLSYSRHTSRFLTVYLLTLPLTLIPLLGWLSVPTMLAIGWSFLSVQEIGHFIEDPFNKDTQVIPLALIISVLRKEISELLNHVLSSKEIDEYEEETLKALKTKSRLQTDNWFEYY